MKYLVANWKANKNLEETKQWLEVFVRGYQAKENVSVIIAPPFPFLQAVKDVAKGLINVHVSAQDISQFEEGSRTGEVTAKSLLGIAEYTIIGHSERRINFNETNETISQKIEMAHEHQIETILCIQDLEDKSTEDSEFIAYEPTEAIGTGNNLSLNDILQFKSNLTLGNSKFLYGGSVTDNNINKYLHSDQIDGLLIGGASLDAESFLRIVSQT